MAYKGKKIFNTKTGQEITFITTSQDSNGELLEMIATYHSFSKEPPAHYHPYQSEDFTVIAGELTVSIDGKTMALQKGEVLHIPPNKQHAMWNKYKEQTIVRWKVHPAMNTEQLLETFSGLANDGRTNDIGRPGMLQVALTANKFATVFRLAKPSFILQKILFSLLTPVALLAGYKAVYRKYLD